jgi:hypothetical protein
MTLLLLFGEGASKAKPPAAPDSSGNALGLLVRRPPFLDELMEWIRLLPAPPTVDELAALGLTDDEIDAVIAASLAWFTD